MEYFEATSIGGQKRRLLSILGVPEERDYGVRVSFGPIHFAAIMTKPKHIYLLLSFKTSTAMGLEMRLIPIWFQILFSVADLALSSSWICCMLEPRSVQ